LEGIDYGYYNPVPAEVGVIFSEANEVVPVGDSNRDGVFNSADFIAVLAAGEYEDLVDGNSNWLEGDWNHDGDFNTADLVFAFQFGSYSAEARAPTAFVDSVVDWVDWLGYRRTRLPRKPVHDGN
jgi:hypothetical protein